MVFDVTLGEAGLLDDFREQLDDRREPVGRGVAAEPGVALGGAAGTLLRYFTVLHFPTPWAVAAINVIGSFAIGLAFVLTGQRELLGPVVMTGFLGGFTTFSAFAIDVRALFVDGAPWPAGCYLLLMPALAVAACWLGVESMHRVQGGRLPAARESGDL